MRSSRTTLAGLALAVLVSSILVSRFPKWAASSAFISRSATPTTFSAQDRASAHALAEAYGELPLGFEPNQGQSDPAVKFLARGNGYTLLLTSTEAVLQLRHSTVLRMKLAGANPAPRVEGLDPLPGKCNYFIGNDRRKWRTNVPHYGKVRYEKIYPGVDLVYYSNRQQLEYDFIVAPGADPKVIALAFQGADRLEIDIQGDLVLHTAGGQIRLHKPFIYQEVNGVRREISGGYALKDQSHVGFQLGAYDATRPLVIDPVLVYSTYLGGNASEEMSGIAVDSSGNAYVMGTTNSGNFPTTSGALQTSPGGGESDVFVAKLNATGTALLYATYLGGRASDTNQLGGIAVDSSGNAYVTGETSSTDFPTTPGAFQTTYNGGLHDVFVAKLNATGSALSYSTYLGTSEGERGFGIAVDSAGQAYVTGTTFAESFPTTPGALQRVIGGANDAFIAKLNAAGSALVYSTFLGGSAIEEASGIAVDATGSAYVTGGTDSTNFPTTPGAFQRVKGAGSSEDAFVARLNPQGGALLYSTYLGGNGPEGGFNIAADTAGNAYVTGITFSPNFPTTPGAFKTTPAGEGDAFVTKLNAQGAAPVYSTFLGGSDGDHGVAIAVDAEGNAYVTGITNSTDFPTRDPLQPAIGGRDDAFVTKLNVAGSALVYSTYLGGRDSDGGNGVAVDATGNAYVTGRTGSSNFPIRPGALQPALGGGVCQGIPCADAFISKIGGGSAAVASVSAASFLGPAVAGESIVAAFGAALATSTQAATAIPLPTSLAGTTVNVRDSAGVERLAPLFFVSPSQINYQIPTGTATGAATLMITSGDGAVSTGVATIAVVAPGLFAANANGQGVAGAVALRIIADGTQSFEPIARLDTTLNPPRFVAVPLDLGPESDQVFLLLFGTGIRFRSSLMGVTVSIGGSNAQVDYAGPAPGFVGLDQLNVRLARSLIGRGEVDITLMVDGMAANTVRASIR